MLLWLTSSLTVATVKSRAFSSARTLAVNDRAGIPKYRYIYRSRAISLLHKVFSDCILDRASASTGSRGAGHN